MVAAAKKSTQMSRQAGRAPVVESTIASMPGKTDTPTVRAARAPGLKVGNNFTGQYLYDRFVNDKAENKLDLTKMEIVQKMCEVMDVSEFEATVAGMVGFANRDVKTTIEAAKQAGNYDSENPTWPIREAQARLNTARAHQTVMRNAWGALKHCAKELEAKLNGQPLAYRMVRDVAAKMLKDKGINWKGEKVESPDGRAARREQQTETAAMLEIQKEHPRKEGESRAEYFTRIDSLTEKRMAEMHKAQHVEEMAKLADKVRAMAGANLGDIIEILLFGVKEVAAQATPAADKNLH